MHVEQNEYAELKNLPAGKYALGLSGGADSTALLLLLRECRPDLALYIVHLNHQTRGEDSDDEERFVRDLSQRWNLPCTIARRSEVESRLKNRPKNKSAFFRAMRLWLFADTARNYQLDGVLLAHHADDQAETVLHRLLRGSGTRGLRGMGFKTIQQVDGQRLVIYRPLLQIAHGELRTVLHNAGQDWREDSSNQSDRYMRNRLRRVLRGDEELSEALRELSMASGVANDWVRRNTLRLNDSFQASELWDLPDVLAESAARRYLMKQGCPAEELAPVVLRRLISMANDAASAGTANVSWKCDDPPARRIDRKIGALENR